MRLHLPLVQGAAFGGVTLLAGFDPGITRAIALHARVAIDPQRRPFRVP